MLCYVTSGYVAFRLALHCWPKYPHLGFEYTMGSPADERRLKVHTVWGESKSTTFPFIVYTMELPKSCPRMIYTIDKDWLIKQ